MNKYAKAAEFIKSKINSTCEICIVLGSGYNELINKLEDKTVIKYEEIPDFVKTTVPGHSGQLVYTQMNGKKVLFMAGRFHFYEGHTMEDITLYVRVLKLLGVKNLILTNATGGINSSFKEGDLVVITDHIKLGLQSPLFGVNDDEFGVRFPDMSEAYNKALVEIAKKAFIKNNIDFKTGVYAFMGGPQFETPAEINMLKTLGADMVGMSTVPEVIAANHTGIKVLGISLISNLAAGISEALLSHDEVMEEGKKATNKFWNILIDIIGEI